jgi:K(+)-stimulated pyrophosphate-energized sodium pump
MVSYTSLAFQEEKQMSNELALWLTLGSAILAILYGLFASRWVLAQPAGNEKMQGIAAAVQEGASAYMNRQYATILAWWAWPCSSWSV